MTKDKPLRHRELWSEEEDKIVIKYHDRIKETFNVLQRTPGAILQRRTKLTKKGLIKRQRRGWTEKEDTMLKNMDKQGLLDKEIAQKLKRKTAVVGQRRQRLKRKGKYPGSKTDVIEREQIKKIKKLLAEDKDILDICIELDISQGTARKRIRRLENEA